MILRFYSTMKATKAWSKWRPLLEPSSSHQRANAAAPSPPSLREVYLSRHCCCERWCIPTSWRGKAGPPPQGKPPNFQPEPCFEKYRLDKLSTCPEGWPTEACPTMGVHPPSVGLPPEGLPLLLPILSSRWLKTNWCISLAMYNTICEFYHCICRFCLMLFLSFPNPCSCSLRILKGRHRVPSISFVERLSAFAKSTDQMKTNF